jgi:hypothetical protein
MRFELLQPHILVIDGLSRRLEAGAVVEGDDVVPTPAMKPLDEDSYQALLRVCDAIRRGGDPNVPGFGHSGAMPGGEIEKAPTWS